MTKAPSRGSGRGLGGQADGVMLALSPGLALLGGDLGDGGAGGGLVDHRLVGREGRDEGLQGEVDGANRNCPELLTETAHPERSPE